MVHQIVHLPQRYEGQEQMEVSGSAAGDYEDMVSEICKIGDDGLKLVFFTGQDASNQEIR